MPSFAEQTFPCPLFFLLHTFEFLYTRASQLHIPAASPEKLNPRYRETEHVSSTMPSSSSSYTGAELLNKEALTTRAMTASSLPSLSVETPLSTPQTATCPLLEKLPAELKSIIFELAFTQDLEDGDQEIELSFAKPPSKHILVTCREIRAIARGHYRAAYRRFWRTTAFTLTFRELMAGFTAREAMIRQLNPLNINNVTKLTIRADCSLDKPGEDMLCLVLEDIRGGWSRQFKRGQKISEATDKYFCYDHVNLWSSKNVVNSREEMATRCAAIAHPTKLYDQITALIGCDKAAPEASLI